MDSKLIQNNSARDDTAFLLVSTVLSLTYYKMGFGGALKAGEKRERQETFISSTLPSKNSVLGNREFWLKV